MQQNGGRIYPFLQLYQISKGWREQCNAFTGAIFTTDGAMNGLYIYLFVYFIVVNFCTHKITKNYDNKII